MSTDHLIMKSLNTQLSKENELLKSHVLDMTERFNIIVDWINNHFQELLGVPEEVVYAIHGKKDILSAVSRSSDEESLLRRGKTNPVTQQSIRNKTLPYNPFIALEKLSLDNFQPLATLNKIVNYDAIVGPLKEINFANNSTLTCTICNRSFKLNIQLNKHKMVHLMKARNKSPRTLRKVSTTSEEINSNNLNQTENIILKWEVSSESSDSESDPLYDPLDNSEENDCNDALCRINTDSIGNDSLMNDPIEIKDEFSEDSQDILKYGNINPVPKSHIQEKGKRRYLMNTNLRATRIYRKIGKEDSSQCTICEKVFPSVTRLREHGRKCHHVPINAIIVTESEIEGVRQTQTTYKCLKCKVHIATSKIEYFSHKRNCHPRKKRTAESNKPGVCEICGKHFLNRRNISGHMRFVHHGEKKFLCTECGKSFSCIDTLRSHERFHTGSKIFKCDYCEESFISRQSKYKHEYKLHLGGLKKVNCHICGHGFHGNAKLNIHIQGVHENRRNHQCPQCEKSFKRKTHLDYHLKTHYNPNSKKRALNKDVDHMKAAQKRRHCNKKNDNCDVQNSNVMIKNNFVNDNVVNALLAGKNISTQ